MSPTDDTFSTEVKTRHEQMISELESISIDALKSEGLRISLGGKTFKFTDLEVIADDSVEDRIRNEFKEKLNDQQQRIREKINAKINQLLVMHQQKQRELDRKEEQMKRKYAETAMMPDINESMVGKGLSVVKGRSNDELCWVYNGEYNPRFLIHYPNNSVREGNKIKKPIPTRLVNKMKQPMIILVRTKGNVVVSVVTKKADGRSLSAFPHYHQQTTQDCWGSWSYPKNWNRPSDILRIAKAAEAVLETINQGSLAEHNPRGLPRMSTLISAVKDVNPVDEELIKKTSGRGRTTTANMDDEDIWSSI
jgi:hypothetical protein